MAYEDIENFVKKCRADPGILHDSELTFFREYLESLGAKIPKKETKSEEKAKEPEPSVPEEPEIPYPELDQTDVISADNDEPLPMGDASKEVSEEDLEKSNESRDLAMSAFSGGDYEACLKHYTQAIELNPGSAILHAKRANVLLKLSKPMAAIRDCEKAIAINPDSAQGYKFRGRANRLLGNWLEAHKDLAMACKLDYDDTANEWLKEVEPNAKKLLEYNRAKDRAVEERKIRERRERVARAQEANKHAAEENHASDKCRKEECDDDAEMPTGRDAGFGFGPFTELFKEFADDPEMLQELKNNPNLITKVLEIFQNPSAIMKHMNDPGVQKLMSKLGSRMGKGAAFPGFGGGASAEAHNDDTKTDVPPEASAPKAPKKAPEPELD